MNIYVYHKMDEPVEKLVDTARQFVTDDDKVFTVIENRRSFRNLTNIIGSGDENTMIIADSVASLGTCAHDASERLRKAIYRLVTLVIVSLPSTIESASEQALNRAVCRGICDTLDTAVPEEYVFSAGEGAGRPLAAYPDGWDVKYKEWKDGKITSKEFIDWSDLKRATFYNKLTEYQMICSKEEDMLKKIRNK